MKRIMVAGVAALALSMSGCAGLGKAIDVGTAAANTPITQAQADAALNTILALKATWITSEKLATDYAMRPICGPATTVPLCSNPKLVAQFAAAAPGVSSSINAAERAAQTVGTTTTVLDAAILAAQTTYKSYVAIMSTAGISK